MTLSESVLTLSEIKKTIPSEVLTALKVLSDENRFALVILLLRNGEMSFSEIQKTSELPKSNLSHHLKVLTQAAILSNQYMKRGDSSEFSYYTATDHARDCIDNILGMFQPKRSATALLKRIIEQSIRYENYFGEPAFISNTYFTQPRQNIPVKDEVCSLLTNME